MQVAFGTGVLWATPILDINGNTITNPTPVRVGVLQEAQITLEWAVKELRGYQQFPFAVGRGGASIKGTAKYAQFNGQSFDALVIGAGYTAGTIITDVFDTTGSVIPATPLAAPVQSATSTATTGGTLAAATYFYVVTALIGTGETVKSNEQSQVTTGSTSTVTVSWASVAGATGYRIYRGTTAGAENVYYTAGVVTSFVDTGAANTSGSPPVTNAAYGITPTVPNGGTWLADLGLINSNSVPLVKVAAAPTTGQYTVTSGAYTFAAADAGATVFIDYQYSATVTGSRNKTVTNPLLGYQPVLAMDLYLPYQGKYMILHLYQNVFSKWALTTKQQDFIIPDIAWQSYADSQGRVYQWSMSE